MLLVGQEALLRELVDKGVEVYKVHAFASQQQDPQLAKCFQSALTFRKPISVLVAVTKAGRDGCEAAFEKPPNKKRREAAKLAAANEVSVDAAAAAVSSEPGGVFIVRKEQRTALKGF